MWVGKESPENSRSKRGNMWAEEVVKALVTGGPSESVRSEKAGTPRVT